ncbi:MAG: GAF domain-containing protein [Myxococcota bacterium]
MKTTESSPGAERDRLVGAMREIGLEMSTTIDFDHLIMTIMDKVTSLMDAERSTLYVVDRGHAEIWSKVAQGPELKEIRLPIGRGVAGWVARSGELANIADAYADPRFDEETDRVTGYTTRSLLCAPTIDKNGRVTGVLQVLNKRGGTFDANDEELLSALASQTSLALEHARLYGDLALQNAELAGMRDELERKYLELDVLYAIEKDISGAQGLEKLLDLILERTAKAIPAHGGSVLLINEDEGVLYFKSAIGDQSAAVRRLTIRLGEGIAGLVASSVTPIISNDVPRDPRHSKAIADRIGYDPGNIICVPLVYGGRTLGAFELLDRREVNGFSQEDLKLLTLIAGQVAKAIHINLIREEEERQGRLAAIGRMLSSLIHDFKTPMTVISGYVELMAVEDQRANREKSAELVLKQCDMLGIMMREVLAYARGESQVLIRKVFVGKFLEEIRDLLWRDLHDHGVEFVMDARYDGAARFDDSKLKRAVFNIARNAREAMPDGGTFSITTEADGGNLVLTMSDTGTGIPDELAGRLLKRDFVTHGKAGGTGLGLSLVKKIVEEHKGNITFKSQAGRTTFVMRIPMNNQ